ncbi:MAG: DUF192 domain-containing protein [Candidatus Woesearchaeota archaeon]
MIKNVKKGTILANKFNVCSNFFTRGIGLMFKKKIIPTILAFKKPTTASIHTFFVRHYLDVLFLNDHWEVIDVVEGLRPKRVYTPKQKAMFVIELPEGTISKSGTRIGDIINFK